MEIEGLLRWLAKRYEPTFRRLRCGGYEDAYQTAWVAYLQALPIVEEKGYTLSSVVVNQYQILLQYVFKRRRRVEKPCRYVDDRNLEYERLVAKEPPVDQQAIIEENLSFCTPNQRRVLERHFLNGESFAEIADDLGSNVAATRRMAVDAKIKIRKHYEEEDYVKGTKVIIKQKPRSEWRHGKEFND